MMMLHWRVLYSTPVAGVSQFRFLGVFFSVAQQSSAAQISSQNVIQPSNGWHLPVDEQGAQQFQGQARSDGCSLASKNYQVVAKLY